MVEKISTLTTEIKVEIPMQHAWKIWTNADDIMQWNIPFDDWNCPVVENDITAGGQFLFRMEARMVVMVLITQCHKFLQL